MPKIQDVLVEASSGKLTAQTCAAILEESENRPGSNGKAGHPLQHVAHVDSGGLRPLKDDYFLRGPAMMVGSEIKPTKGMPKFHSQFRDTQQAAGYLKDLFESKAGRNALALLESTEWNITVKYGIGPARQEQLSERTLQLISNTDPNYNFVMFTDKSIRSVVAVLHRVGGSLLHIQTFYPTQDAFPAGVGQVEFQGKGKSKPDCLGYSVLP